EQQPPQMPTAPAQAVSTVEFGTTTIASVTTTGLNTYRKYKQEQKAKYNTGSTSETRRDKGYTGQATGQDFRIYSSSYTARSYTRDRLGHILIYNGDELYKAEFVKYMVGYCYSSFTTVSDYMRDTIAQAKAGVVEKEGHIEQTHSTTTESSEEKTTYHVQYTTKEAHQSQANTGQGNLSVIFAKAGTFK
ncbi:unnamed protein product, partial [Cladocopium goreaui]